MLRSLLVLVITAFGGSILAAPPAPVAATPVSFELANPTLEAVAVQFRDKYGMAVEVSEFIKGAKVGAKTNGPFWYVVEQLTAEASCLAKMQGGKLLFVPGVTKPVPSSIDGPFRSSVRQVVAKRDFQSGDAVTEVHLDVHWEPRFPVYLIDAEPKLTKAAGEKGNYTADPPSGRVTASGYVHPMVVRLKGVPREEKSLSVLSGSFKVIAAEKMLAVEFKDLTSDKPIEKSIEGVKVVLKPVKSQNGPLEIGFDLEYPPSHPEFESFQEWAGTNKLRVFDATGNVVKETNYNTSENGRKITANYFLTAPKGPLNLKGWRLVYETPSPMAQQEVRFELKDILLP